MARLERGGRLDARCSYEFDDVARVRAIPGSDALKRLVAEFDRAWGDKVTRSRDIVQVIQAIASAN